MLDVKTREKLMMNLYPNADRAVFGPEIEALDQYLKPGARVLDAGSNKGTWLLRDFRSRIGYWVGADIEVPQEKRMDNFVLCDLASIPLADASFDVILCHYVIEHLPHPRKVFAEFWRLLDDGGVFLFMTPSIYAPIFLLSRWTPVRWHESIKSSLLGLKEAEAFPTYYRCNTAGKLDRTLREIGFRKEILDSVEDLYYYFTFNSIAYATGLLASRLIQLFPLAKPFRSQLIGVYRKP